MNFIRCAVIGHPIAHSKSPLIHTHWINAYGLNGAYTAIDIAPDDLQQKIKTLIDDGYAGLNVTVPHKQSMMDLCDDLDDTATAIGAVNTIVFQDGKIHGRNTDAFGFLENIKQAQPEFSFAQKTVVLLGAGGAARAAVYAMLQENVGKIFIVNRTIESAQNLCHMDAGRLQPIAWEQRDACLAEADILINTTSLGMRGKDPLEISLESLPRRALVHDIVYAPLMTDLLADAKQRGNAVITGIGMLLHQARPAFKAWFGVMPDVDDALMNKVLA
jgi:shikimate dehydrogenase